MQTANSAKAETILEANAKAKAEQILSQIKQQPPKIQVPKPPKVKSDIEKFIGENLANKVGIIITVIGVAIGAKYAIDHDLISPLTRIILGYLVGLGLMGFAIKLKTKYENFSAVLLSGAIAILYFITFAAYSFYGLFPQLLAFNDGLLYSFHCTFGYQIQQTNHCSSWLSWCLPSPISSK